MVGHAAYDDVATVGAADGGAGLVAIVFDVLEGCGDQILHFLVGVAGLADSSKRFKQGAERVGL